MFSPWTRALVLVLLATVTLAVSSWSNVKKAYTSEKGKTVILGTLAWDIETNKQGQGNGYDVWWKHVNEKKKLLVPQPGVGLVDLGKKDFDKFTRENLAALKYSQKEIPNTSLVPGTVLALRTKEGNFTKLKVIRYRHLHDFSFPEADIFDADAKEFFLQKPNIKNYHLEVEWVLYRKTKQFKSKTTQPPPIGPLIMKEQESDTNR